jgi:sugar/nucleoside kinase (ribokinase family)
MKTRDVLGLGCATIDELFFVDEFPAPDAKTPIQRAQIQGGGLGATALVAGARLGANCAYAGMLGFDETSKRVAQILQNEGVSIDLITWREDAAAIRSLIFVDESRHTRNIFFQKPGLVGAAPDAPSESEIANSRVLFVDHYGGHGNTRAIQIARHHQVPIVADFERTNVPHFDEFFPLVDHLVLSRSFAQKLTNQTEIEPILRALWNGNRAVVVVTDGERGCWSLENNAISHQGAHAVAVVDTTGCGDVFHGVYAATLAWDFPLEVRLKWASIAAALKARSVGAQAGIPAREEIEKHL